MPPTEVARDALKRARNKIDEINQRGGDAWFNQQCAVALEDLKIAELELAGIAEQIARDVHRDAPGAAAAIALAQSLERLERMVLVLGGELGVDPTKLRAAQHG